MKTISPEPRRRTYFFTTDMAKLWAPHPLVILLLSSLPWISLGRGIITMRSEPLTVNEGDMFSVTVHKEGTANSDINVVVEILNANEQGGQDFVGTSQPTVVPGGMGSVDRSVVFTVRNDDIPEADETFVLRLKVTNGDGESSLPDTTTVTILANDDAYGVFSFEDTLPRMVVEPSTNMFKINRNRGNFGTVQLNYEVRAQDGSLASTDISPSSGTVVFVNGQRTLDLKLDVINDVVAENDETFIVSLVTTAIMEVVNRGGSEPTIDHTRNTVTFIVSRNDAPIRFSQAEYRTTEDDEDHSLTLTISRGLDSGSNNFVGPLTGPATVDLFFVSRTAKYGEDFVIDNITVPFAPGIRQAQVGVEIKADDIPEVDEEFDVILANPSGDAVVVEPAKATIIIQTNDEPNGIVRIKTDSPDVTKPVFYFDEDEQGEEGIVVTRSPGHFGKVTIDWVITRPDSIADVLTDLERGIGTLTFEDGEEEAVIKISVRSDRTAESAEKFLLELLPNTITGGARVNGATSADVIIEDSDDIYGVVDLAGDELQMFGSDLVSSPRTLEIRILRTGGAVGIVQVEFNVEYQKNEGSSTGDIFVEALPRTLVVGDQQRTATFALNIRDDAFLEFGALFHITLLNVALMTAPATGAYNSPRLGATRSLEIKISSEAANGIIGFQDPHVTRRVVEPNDGRQSVQIRLDVERNGTNGLANIEWELFGVGENSAQVTEEDITPFSGSLILTPGTASGVISIEVLADDIPETDEMVQVRIVRVTPEGSQMIKNGSDSVDIVIQENDMPGGVFEFGTAVDTKYTVEEDGVAIEVTVVRYGGSLTTRYVQHIIEPNGEVEFYGSTYVMKFEPGETIKNSTIIARSDGIAEVEEIFHLRLINYNGFPATIGRKNLVNITVLENDNPYGIFQFKENSAALFLNESKAGSDESVLLTVVRTRGLFREVSVRWYVIPGNHSDEVEPSSGILVFPSGQREVSFRLRSLPDEMPEGPEQVYINLTDPTGGSIIGTPQIAEVTINTNDHPIFFKPPAVYRIPEPEGATPASTVIVTVMRKNFLSLAAQVRFQTIDGTAKAGELDYIPVSGTIRFNSGQSEFNISVLVLGDNTPETDEYFYIELFDPQGDVSVFGGNRSTVIIEANDIANGIFSFVAPFSQTASEGEVVKYNIRREGGLYKEVYVHYEVVDITTDQRLPNGGDFELAKGNVTFVDQQVVGQLEIRPAMDNIPEYEESFRIRLTGVSGGDTQEGDLDPQSRLATNNLEVTLEVRSNDDPSGVFAFSPDTRSVSVAEDVGPNDLELTRALLNVTRYQGTDGDVMVAWEISSNPISSAGRLPIMRDLLFLADSSPNLTDGSTNRRLGTGSVVLYFSGCDDCFATVPVQDQMPADTIEDGFSISAWVQPDQGTDGYVLAKTSGQRYFYALKITAIVNVAFTRLEFRYTAESNPLVTQIVTRTFGVSAGDGRWHHLVVTVDSGLVDFFLDNKTLGSSRLPDETIQDGDGVLTVGALPSGDQRYTGYMQDVRVYSRKLDIAEISDLYSTPALEDLYPISGFLRYAEGERYQMITVFTKDDKESEPNEYFAVRLTNAKGGARVSDVDGTAILTVLKSDNANGLFRFSGPCVQVDTGDESSPWRCPIERRRGDSEAVTLTWEVRGPIASTTDLAESDFVNATGTVVFGSGQLRGDLIMYGIDDDIPETMQTFRVTLTNAASEDGLVGSTPTSGASIEPGNNSRVIAFPENDYPFGLFEFTTADTPPADTDPRIPPSTEPPSVNVSEESGQVELLVIRAQGLNNRVTVEWRTIDGTAVSSGKTPPDYIARSSTLVFNQGQRYAYITVDILDNAVPEDVKTFDVQLVNPQGGAAVGLGSRITVRIGPSDQAFGVFGFAAGSLIVSTKEEAPPGEASSEVALRVERMGGSIGDVQVAWSVLADTGMDLGNNSGVLNYQSGQTEALIVILVRDDSIPELDEQFTVQLTSTTLGSIGSNSVSRLTVEANDDPYGIFIISQDDRPRRTPELSTVVTITVLRQDLSGHYGMINVTWRTLVPGESYPYLPGGTLRAGTTDFAHTSGWVVFAPNEESAKFNVTIYDDSEPEIEESVFVMLTDVELIEANQMRPGSPRLGSQVETYAQIIIEENDNPAGVLQLSAARVDVTEESVGNVLFVNRSAGTFGQVTVKFEVIAGTATYGLDYSITSTDVVLPSGETMNRVPVEIINDQIPELEEIFTVRLLDQITGGATLGAMREATVVIHPSDDPYGVFSFEENQRSVEEPGADRRLVVSLPVIRKGGAVGVVTVTWASSLGGGEPTGDISPTSGVIYFVSNDARQNITIEILPDEIPEGIESIVLTLVTANNGGRIDTDRHQLIVNILPNDNPHGGISFGDDGLTVHEGDVNDVQFVHVQRLGGNYGQVRVFYETHEVDIIALAKEEDQTILSYYDQPIPGKVDPPAAGTPYPISNMPNPLEACATFCLMSEACLSFDFNPTVPDCNWFTISDDSYVSPRQGYVYYQTDQEKKTALYRQRARPGLDYTPVTSGDVILADGATTGLLPVTILADDIPELPEIFRMKLTRVELVGGPPNNPGNLPTLGPHMEAVITIAKNDDANGIFHLVSADPRAMDDRQTIMVEEREKFSVELIVERHGGTIGEVSVTWAVDPTNTTATGGIDYIADGATLRFEPGDTRRTLTIGIEDDDIPEMDEQIVVFLKDAVGGATISDQKAVTVVVRANDNVAGRLYFTKTSYLVKEGDVLMVIVERTEPALGEVTVDWEITTTNSQTPELRFDVQNGTLTYLEGENRKEVEIEVLVDNQPKVNQEYQIKLLNLRTSGVPATGAAGVDSQKAVAVVTIEGGNEPHGVFSFATGARHLRVAETVGNAELTIDRKFGAIGDVRVNYEVKMGSMSALSDSLQAAVAQADFLPVAAGYITVRSGENSGVVPVSIFDDTLPEVDEVLLVSITSVELLTQTAGNFLPKLASSGVSAEVIIEANDGTFGEVVFSVQSERLFLEEETLNVTLAVLRNRGTFGDVSVFCFAQSVNDGATRGTDFDFEPREITFLAGETVKYVVVAIYDDDVPEPNEQLEIILASPKDGLTIGDPHKSTITILASDRASGVVSFESSETLMLNEPTAVTSAHSRAELRLTRAPGVFGIVNVPYEVRHADGSANVTDLEPTGGYITFQDREGTVSLELTVKPDDIPEETETFLVTLLPPDKASLGLITQRKITIERNDAPYGLLQIYPAGSRNRTVTSEEGPHAIFLDVFRSQGSLDEISVDLVTRGITAYSQMGSDVYLSPLQQINVRDMTRWVTYEMSGETYLVLLYDHKTAPLTTAVGSTGAGTPVNLGNITQSVLFRWQGAAVLVQSIETDGAKNAVSFSIDESTYVFIVNGGSRTRRETRSRLYMVNKDGTLRVVQDIRTQGATDSVYFSAGSDHFLVITNSADNTGRTSINSDVYQWDYFSNRFGAAPVQYLPTRGAAAAEVTTADDGVYLVIANNRDESAQTYEINSIIYRLDASNRFTVHQQIPTRGATDVTSFHIGSDAYVVVANGQDDSSRHHQTATVYVWNRVTQLFSPVQEIAVAYVGAVQSFVTPDGKVHLSVAMQRSPSAILTWDDDVGQFNQTWVGPPLRQLQPTIVNQRAGPLVLMLEARPVNESAANLVPLNQMSRLDLGDSDFVHRALTLTFKPDQSSLRTSVVLLDDDVPEDTEALAVELINPRGGGELGASKEVVIDILSNDNGHGILEFAEDSLDRYEEEIPARDNLVQLNVVRRAGTNGRVVVSWRAEGEHNAHHDMTPTEGQLEFADGQAVASITLTIKDDQVSELDEVTRITLVNIVESGTPLPGRGAKIGEKSSAKLTVMANDSPHGVVAWERSSYITTEPEGTDTTTMLHIVRTQGSLGVVRVAYITSLDINLPEKQRAVSGRDYVAVQSSVDMLDGVTRVPVEITILSDLDPEVAETFLVNITGVQLVGGSSIVGAGASVRRPGNVASLTIAENDDARGVVQFSVARNAEGRFDTYEGAGTISLKLVRTIGFFGDVQVAWQASPRQATADDFTPGGGTVTFGEGQDEAFIEISIIDDTIPEDLETFDIQLIRVTSGGATLGANNSVRIGIRRNDSPNGIFSFVQTTKTVRESSGPDDADGVVSFDVQRAGTDGVVNVEWRLSPDAVDDFVPPLTGIITFGPGESYKRIALRTAVDTILEGEEEFTLSLVSADNNADISPSEGDATVVILADTGAGGVISIAPQSRNILLGEPSLEHSGRAEIVLERTVGTFGEVRVTWQITRRDMDAFVNHQDTVVFADRQAQASFLIQTKDDNAPELRHTYTMEITSATGGASVAPGERTAEIIVVASDHPHGLFEFGTPQDITVSEDVLQVTIPVERHAGSVGQVRVEYKTTPGTAVSDETLTPDFRSSSGWLVFGNNQRRQTVSVDIVNDARAEGPEYFFLNLTGIELQQPTTNNYTEVNGLQLDMAPEIGELNFKQVTIDKNDNAEGVVEFALGAVSFIVQEEDGVASLPVVRGPGTFGDVRVAYTLRNVTATPGTDFRLSGGELVLSSGAATATINVMIVDDTLREFAETFEVSLTDISGGALLGARTTATVTIAKSDFPNGLFSFVGQTTVAIPNPEQTRSLALSIERTRGLIGRQTLYWRIMGPNNPNRVLQETNDVSSPSQTGPQNLEVTSGVLQWEANEDGRKSFQLTVKPHAGWEIEKIFNVVIYDIQGFPASSGSGEASVTANNFTLVVQKFGHPNGIVRFDGVAQQLRIFQEPVSGKRLIRFPLYRTEGTIGNVKVNWQVLGTAGNNVSADIEPSSGTAVMPGDRRDGEIVLYIVADGDPELDEVFFMYLTSAENGAEIDSAYNSSRFTIQYNGYPHGRFSLEPEAQTVVVSTGALQRSVRLNVTRHDGTVGRVRVSYTVVYDQVKYPVGEAQSGISYIPSAGAVQFEDGSRFGIALIDIENTVSIASGTSFTATLTDAVYIGVDVTMRPQLMAGRTTAKIYVTPEAANSEVGFKDTVISVDEATNLVDVLVSRRGTYGGVQVDWVTGYPETETPSGFSRGRLSEEAGVASMSNTVNSTTYKVQLSPRPAVPELFALHLPRKPISQTAGGAELWPGREVAQIEPYGVVRFDTASLNVNVQESEDREVEVTLNIERVYGSLGPIQIRYNTYSGTALGGVDYQEIQNGAVNMDPRQTQSTIFVTILSDTIPEEDEHFFVNFTSITRLPTGPEQGVSPRLSSLYSSARVTITRNNDPYGVVSIILKSTESDGKFTEPSTVTFSILRTGGTFGPISVLVRTIGGGESWDSQVGMTQSRDNDTISQALGNRNILRRALAGRDYQVVDRLLHFRESETEKELTAVILDDTSAEDDEVFFVYLVPQTDGVRVAQPSTDNGRRGFAFVTIRRNDFWNGWIGFARPNSTRLEGDEDSGRPIRLTIERLNATFGTVSVRWKAVPSVENPQLELSRQLQRDSSTVDCPAGNRFCVFEIPIINDMTPENETRFTVELESVGDGAQIDPARRFATVWLLASDNPNGLVQFAESSRAIYVSKSSNSVRLDIQRLGYLQKRVTVRVSTLELPGAGPDVIANVLVYRALDGADFNSYQATLIFQPGESTQSITLTMDLSRASDNPYPKMFRVALSDVTNGAVLGVDRANITIVNQDDVSLWNLWTVTQKDLTNNTIDGVMRDLEYAVREPLSTPQLSIVENNLERVVSVAEQQPLLQGSRISIMAVFCRLLDPRRADSTRGRWQLNSLLERFTYSYLVEFGCDNCCTGSTLIYSPECQYMQFAVAKWYPEDINNYRYQIPNQDSFVVPQNLLRVQDNGRNSPNPKCFAVSFIQYSSSQWFLRDASIKLLNDRVFSVAIKGQPSRQISNPAIFTVHTPEQKTAAQKASCAYFDEDIQVWTTQGCEVRNNLELAVHTYVECSCRHMSSYAVISQVKNTDHIGYPVWFYISCAIAMAGLLLAIISHHTCFSKTMFSANLLMHFVFAVFVTELCYVIDAGLSANHLLKIEPDEANSRCIVMSIFLLYFFLAQFTWLVMQSLNFWKILIMNDEHTERKYVLYFMLGWGLPALLDFTFCIVVYLIYRYAVYVDDQSQVDRFFWDVTGNKDICFIVNPFVASAVVVIAAICIMVVIVVFIHAFKMILQWQHYDDIYRFRYNIHEIRLLLLFWGLVVLTWLFGGLHMALGQLWMLILFCIFNVAIGIYAALVYSILRNRWCPCLRPQRASYVINNVASDVGDVAYPPPGGIPSIPGSIKGSRASLIHDAWERDSMPNGNGFKVKRPVVSNGGAAYIIPAPAYEAKPPPASQVPPAPLHGHRPTGAAHTDPDSQSFDDLIQALKTGGGYTPSDSSHPPNPHEIPDPTEPNYEMRRISIADTHL